MKPRVSNILREFAGWLPFAAWAILYLGARIVLELPGLPNWARLVAAVLPIPAFAAFLIAAIRGIRSMDELHIRIHLEALAIAFPLSLLLIMTLGLLELAVGLSPDDWSYRHIWPFLFIFYLAGLAIATRRYQ